MRSSTSPSASDTRELSRLRIVRCPALAALLFVLLPAVPSHAQRAPTTQTSIGIFYRPGAPAASSLWREGDRGERLQLDGRVLDRSGQAVSGAQVELWHADTGGGVDETRYRAALVTAADGRFVIRTALPGHIEMARYNTVFAPRHIHVRVTHPGHPTLVSLIFFKGDERLADTPYPELAIPLEKVRTSSGEYFIGGIEVVLGAAPLPAEDWLSPD